MIDSLLVCISCSEITTGLPSTVVVNFNFKRTSNSVIMVEFFENVFLNGIFITSESSNSMSDNSGRVNDEIIQIVSQLFILLKGRV